MSNETKRDVFEKTLTLYRSAVNVMNENGLDEVPDIPASHMLANYDAALPDDLPVIPEAVGEWLAWCKERAHSLKDALDGETRVSEDTFARAWLDDVWRVEETGEIVKLEA